MFSILLINWVFLFDLSNCWIVYIFTCFNVFLIWILAQVIGFWILSLIVVLWLIFLDKMPRYDDRYGGTRLYVGRLSSRTRSRDLDDLFSRYGRYAYFCRVQSDIGRICVAKVILWIRKICVCLVVSFSLLLLAGFAIANVLVRVNF